VNVVTVAALNQLFIHSMPVRLGKLGFGCGVASVTKLGLAFDQEKLRFSGVVRRMTINAANIIAGVNRGSKVRLLGIVAVAAQASAIGFGPGEFFEADDLGNVSACGHVCRTRPVAGLTSVLVLPSGLEMLRALEALGIGLLMAGFAGVRTGILGFLSSRHRVGSSQQRGCNQKDSE
jgi:hypothetical protein